MVDGAASTTQTRLGVAVTAVDRSALWAAHDITIIISVRQLCQNTTSTYRPVRCCAWALFAAACFPCVRDENLRKVCGRGRRHAALARPLPCLPFPATISVMRALESRARSDLRYLFMQWIVSNTSDNPRLLGPSNHGAGTRCPSPVRGKYMCSSAS